MPSRLTSKLAVLNANHSQPARMMHAMRVALKRGNGKKVAGPDSIPELVLRICAKQLVPVFTSMFIDSIGQSTVMTYFTM